MEANKAINEFRIFLEDYHKKDILDNLRTGRNFIEIEFTELSKFNIDLANQLLKEPEETLKAAQIAVEQFDIEGIERFSVMFVKLPSNVQRHVWEVRKEDVGKFVALKGTINKSSDIITICTSAKFECPVCLPKGTLVLTPNGLKPIETIKEVITVDSNFKPEISSTNSICTGKKEAWVINDDITSSKEHKWFVYRNGKTMVIQTKDLNIGDILYQINYDTMYNLQREPPHALFDKIQEKKKIHQKNMFTNMQKEILQPISAGGGKNKNKQPTANQIVCSGEEVFNPNCTNIEHQPKTSQKEAFEKQNSSKEHKHPMQIEFETKGAQAWKEMWRERLSKTSKAKSSLEVPIMRKNKRRITKEKFGCSPQKRRPSRQPDREFDGVMPVMPYKITSLRKTNQKIEMYDLIVPTYNNFILSNGVITHNCGNIINISQLDNKFKKPSKCGCGRQGQMLEINKEMENIIKIGVIDDLLEESNINRAMAREKLVILPESLTTKDIDMKIKPGKKVMVNGYFSYEQKMETTEFNPIFHANSIEFVEVGWNTVKVSKKEEEGIKGLSKDDKIISRLAESIADVEGYPEVKIACILQLAGSPNMYDVNRHLQSRGTIHLLLIGDPGVSKSYLAKRAGSISPISSFQSAATASGRGLVASVVNDKEIGAWAVYPGVVVMASKGICIIDEIDKTHPDDYGDHNNAMNDMVVVVAKSNVKAKLDAETSYLATANPEHRIFTAFELYSKQINMPKDFLDRFDIIFPMMTSGDKATKEKIMDIMLNRHIKVNKDKTWVPEFNHDFIRKYIAYCRKVNPEPKLPSSLFPFIKQKLHELMSPRNEEEERVSFRQLESILRFAYASARLRLRDVTKEDILLAFDLKRKSFVDLGIISSTGEFQWAKMEDIPQQEIDNKRKMNNIIDELLPDRESKVTWETLLEKAKEQEISEREMEGYLEKMKQRGDLYEPARNVYMRL